MQTMQELGWSQVVELMEGAPEDLDLSQRLHKRPHSLTWQKIYIDSMEKARVLRLWLSRGHALLKQAVKWDQLLIGRQQQSNRLDVARDSL